MSTESTADAETVFRKAQELAKNGETEEAFRLYMEAAETGHPIAAYMVGQHYAVGAAVEKNERESMFWTHMLPPTDTSRPRGSW
ncbi:hypothetical protein [Methanomethylophilus alvi]|uniref:hypothetical protein n=1 Tax=Methanomethylophilus alvi TaxID=1291540 RepID=UPI0037DDA36E